MLNPKIKTTFYSITFFFLIIASATLIMKNVDILPNPSREGPDKGQTITNDIEEESFITKETSLKAAVVAPDFTFPDVNGKLVSLSQYRGKIVFLNIWATWCGPCRIEMPAMEKLYNKFKRKDLVILAVSIDSQGESVVKPFIKELGITFPILLSVDGSIQNTYRVNALPSSFIINKSGLIVAQVIGARDWFGPKTIETFEYLLSET